MARTSARIDGGGRSELVALGWVGLAAVVLVYAMLVVERQGLRHALHLAAPPQARPGTEIAITGYVFDATTESGLPELVRAEIDVALLDGERTLATTHLTQGSLDVAAGVMVLPEGEGERTIRAVARLDGSIIATSTRPIHLAADAAGSPELSRTAPLLMHFDLGPIVTAAGQLPPPRFDVLVQAGVCVPEEPCTLLVDLGAVGYELELLPGPLVELRGAPRTDGNYVAIAVAVNGPEGEGELVVRQAGVEVARRTVRLPMALATPWLDVDLARARGGTLAVAAVPPPGRTTVVLDVFRSDQWIRSVTLEGLSSDDLLGGEPLPPGIYRIEARADAFRTERVTSRVLRVGDGGEDAPPLLRRDGLAFELAAAEAEIVGLELPESSSGLEQDRATLDAQKRAVRYIALAGMILAIVLVMATVARRGAVANAQASAVLQMAGSDPAAIAQRRSNLTLVLLISGLGLGLAGAAALVMARQLVIGG